MSMIFEAVVELGGKTATGIQVPDDVMAELGGGQRPAVVVTLGEYSYRTTAAKMAGRFLVPLSAENRQAAGVAAGDVVQVEIVLDVAPREVVVPADLDAALDAPARAYFDTLSFSHRKEWVRWIEESKKAETRASRVSKTVDTLREGRPRR
jgi:hypothetical protein